MTHRQDPSDKRTYELVITDDTVSSATWAVSPTGPTVGSSTEFTEGDNAGSRVLFGPASAGNYTLTCTITAGSGQIVERSFIIRVGNL